MFHSALRALLLSSAVVLSAWAQTVDLFRDADGWQAVKDGGNAPALVPEPDGLRAVYKEAKPGWGNIARGLRMRGDEESVRVEVRLLAADAKAAMHFWLVEPDGDLWLAPLGIDGKTTGTLPPGEHAFVVPLTKLTFQPRGDGIRGLYSCNRMMLGFNFGDQTVLLRRLAFAEDAAAAARVRAAQEPQARQREDAMYRIAIFDDPSAPTPTVASSPDRLAEILGGEGIRIVRLDGAALADGASLDASRIDLLVLPYGPSFPAEAEDTIRQFCKKGGDFLSLGGYAFDQPYVAGGEEALPNLLRNPGFEEPDTGVWGLDEGSMQEGDASKVVRRSSSDQPHEGTACFEITVPDAAPKAWYNVTQRVDGVLPGKMYLATCQLRTKDVHNGFAYMAVGFYDKDGKRISFVHGHASVKGDGTTPWTEQKASFQIPGGTAYATVHGHLYGYGTAWFDAFEMKRQTLASLNTRHGKAGDALSLGDDQIGVFDASYVFERTTRTETAPLQHIVRAPVRLRTALAGHAAVGMTSPNNAVSPKPRARWTSLVQAFDDYGRLTGTLLGITHNFAGTFRHSLWAYCGVENLDPTEDAGFAGALREVRDHLMRGVFLHSPTLEYMLYRPGETVKASARVANAGWREATHTVLVELLVDGQSVAERRVDVVVPADEEMPAAAEFPCPEAATGVVEVRMTLLADDRPVDMIRTAFLVPLPGDSQGLALGYADNYFTSNGRPAILFGTNQTGVMFGPDYENVLTWMEDYGRCRDFGLNVWRLLHISPYADPDFRKRGHQILENPPEWLLRRMDAVFLLAQRYRVVPFPCWHDWTGGTAVSNENLRQQRAFVRIYGERYKHLSAMLWDVSNEAATRANPIHDLNWLFRKFLREKYLADEAMRAAWDDPGAAIETAEFKTPPQEWHSRRALDFERFRVEVASRWLEGNITAMRETGDTHPASDEYYLLPGGDAFSARRHITFSNIHRYPDWTPGGLRYYDRRMQGRAFTVGEFGRRHHPSMKGGGWSWLPEPKVRDFFRRATFMGVGCGTGMMLNWDWKDMRGCIFPWGIHYPNELVPKQVARDWRNLAVFFRSFRPRHLPEDLCYVIPDQFLLGGRQRELEGRIQRSLDALSDTNIPFSVVRQYELPDLAAAPPKILVFPLPYILDDAEVALLADIARRGSTVYLSGDMTYDAERQPTRARVLETLCGVKLDGRRYPDIRREGEPVAAFAEQPSVRYDAQPALRLAGQEDVLVRRALGKGQVLFLNDPIELHADRATLRKVYAHLFDLPPLSRESDVLAYRLPTLDGELRLLLNEGEEARTLELAAATLALPGGSQVAAHVTADGRITAVATDGAVSLGAPFASGSGRKLILALDGKGLETAEALLVLPLGEGDLRLARDLPVAVGEIVDGRWRTYETLPTCTEVAITELRSTALLLLCPAEQRERWCKAVEILVTRP